MVLAMLVSCFCTVLYAEADADYFEPVYSEDNWTVTAASTAAVTFDSAAKSIVTSGSGIKTAEYKSKGLTGDVILAFDAKFGGTGGSNHNKITLGKMIFDFKGNGDFGFKIAGNDEISKEKAYTKSSTNSIVITYKSTGEVKVYEVSGTKQVLVFSYVNPSAADQNDGTLIIEDRYAGSITVSNIKMYKPNQSFTDDFGDTISDRWDLPVGVNYSIKPVNQFMIADGGASNNTLSKTVMLKKIFTTGSYSISATFTTANTNYQHILFNKSSDNEYYALSMKLHKDAANGNYFILELKKRNDKSSSTVSGATELLCAESDRINAVANTDISLKIDYLAAADETGSATINVYANDGAKPVLTATDSTSVMGKVGICLTKTNVKSFKVEPIQSETPEFSVGEISVTGSISANGTAVGSAVAKNTTDEQKNAVIIMAVYKNGEVADVKTQAYPLAANSGETELSITYNFGNISDASDYTVKCFVFNSLEDILPLTQAKPFGHSA